MCSRDEVINSKSVVFGAVFSLPQSKKSGGDNIINFSGKDRNPILFYLHLSAEVPLKPKPELQLTKKE